MNDYILYLFIYYIYIYILYIIFIILPSCDGICCCIVVVLFVVVVLFKYNNYLWHIFYPHNTRLLLSDVWDHLPNLTITSEPKLGANFRTLWHRDLPRITTGDGIRHLQDRANNGTLGNNELDHQWVRRLLCDGSLRCSVRCALSHSVVQKRSTSFAKKKGWVR